MFMESKQRCIQVRIINEVQANLEELSDLLRLPPNTVINLKAQPGFTTGSACREVFKRWLEATNDPRVPKTWETVVKVVRILSNHKLAGDIEAILKD